MSLTEYLFRYKSFNLGRTLSYFLQSAFFFPLFFFSNVLFLKVLCNLFILFLIFISWGSPLMADWVVPI